MLLKALMSFAGKVSMYEGEIREVAEKEIADDLINAGFAIEYEADRNGKKPSKEDITPKAAETPVKVPNLSEKKKTKK